MKKMLKLLMLLLLTSTFVLAQRYSISGVIKAADSGEKLTGANVYINDLQTGATTDIDGKYAIQNVPNGTYELTVSFVGYVTQKVNIRVNNNIDRDFALESSSVLLQETVVKGTRAKLRETPVAFAQISGAEFETKLASRDLPMLLASTPNVYSQVGGGGAGDANMVVRGFDQKNIAVMINGVPVNDMEGRTVYWSNWAGLGDVTQDAQIQRGLSATPYSVNSVGGIVNVQTYGIGSGENFYRVKSEYGTDNLGKLQFSAKQKVGNFGVVGLISRKTWDGYAVGTYHKEWTYYFAVGGVFGNHSVELQAVGTPQEHGQRIARQTMANWKKYGKNYNANVGRLNGGIYNDALNQYHKPAINLNWNWQVADKSNLSTILYYSMGRGWGSRQYGTSPKVISTGEFAGYKDYDAVFTANKASIDTKYSATEKKALTYLGVRANDHDWYGLLSTFTTALNDEMKLTAGIDGRYYEGFHYVEVKDLMGADYVVDIYKDGTGGNINNPTNVARIGDKVQYNYDGNVRSFGGFAQLEYKSGPMASFVNVSLASQGMRRKDHFNYKPEEDLYLSEWVNFTGYTLKTGVNYNFDENNSAYVNVGYLATPPSLSNIFVGFNSRKANTLYKDATTEKVMGADVGYSFINPDFSVRLNGYYTSWKDRAFTITTVTQSGFTSYNNVMGAKQIHMGVELDLAVRIMRNLKLYAAAAVSDAEYGNDVKALISDDTGALIKEVVSYVDGLKVPNTPFQKVNVSLEHSMDLGSGLRFNFTPEFEYVGKRYAYFNADTRTNANDRAQSWKLPDYTMVNLFTSLDFYIPDFLVKKVKVGFTVFNLLNNDDYIIDGTDGSGHLESTATVYYGRERSMNLSLTVNF